MKTRRKITRIAIVSVNHDRTIVSGPLSWFDVIKRETVAFGECRAVDNHGRVFARSYVHGTTVTVTMERGDRNVVGEPGEMTSAAAIELAERYRWSAPFFVDNERERGLAAIAAERK